MRTAIMALVLAGCTASPMAPPPEEHISFFTADPYILLSATHERPLRWGYAHTEGLAPRPATIEHVSRELDLVIGRTSHVLVEPAEPLAPTGSDHQWTRRELHSLRAELVHHFGAEGPFVLLLFLDGYGTSFGSNATGLAVANMAVVFSQRLTLARAAPGAHGVDPAAPVLERALALHEVGHVLGLVDNGIEMVHDRATHPGDDPCACHSTSTASVMRPTHGYVDAVREEVATGSMATRFDVHDLQDLHKARMLAFERHPVR